MPSLKRCLLENQCYHTISVTLNREPIFEERHAADVVVSCLKSISLGQKSYVLAYALMPDHLHLLVVPRSPTTLPKVMQSLKGYSSRLINEKRGRRGSIWQPSYFDRVVRTEAHLEAVAAYIEQNPVAAELASKPEEYSFSSAWPGAVNDRAVWLEADRRGWKASATPLGYG